MDALLIISFLLKVFHEVRLMLPHANSSKVHVKIIDVEYEDACKNSTSAFPC
jgi:hypothetical protein